MVGPRPRQHAQVGLPERQERHASEGATIICNACVVITLDDSGVAVAVVAVMAAATASSGRALEPARARTRGARAVERAEALVKVSLLMMLGSSVRGGSGVGRNAHGTSLRRQVQSMGSFRGATRCR